MIIFTIHPRIETVELLTSNPQAPLLNISETSASQLLNSSIFTPLMCIFNTHDCQAFGFRDFISFGQQDIRATASVYPECSSNQL